MMKKIYIGFILAFASIVYILFNSESSSGFYLNIIEAYAGVQKTLNIFTILYM